jgi:hypothetical protein
MRTWNTFNLIWLIHLLRLCTSIFLSWCVHSNYYHYISQKIHSHSSHSKINGSKLTNLRLPFYIQRSSIVFRNLAEIAEVSYPRQQLNKAWSCLGFIYVCEYILNKTQLSLLLQIFVNKGLGQKELGAPSTFLQQQSQMSIREKKLIEGFRRFLIANSFKTWEEIKKRQSLPLCSTFTLIQCLCRASTLMNFHQASNLIKWVSKCQLSFTLMHLIIHHVTWCFLHRPRKEELISDLYIIFFGVSYSPPPPSSKSWANYTEYATIWNHTNRKWPVQYAGLYIKIHIKLN